MAFKKREVFEREQYSVVASGREEHTQASYHSQSPRFETSLSCLHYFDHFSSLSLFFLSLSQIVGVSLMHVYWAHFWSMSSHRGNTGQGQPAQV